MDILEFQITKGHRSDAEILKPLKEPPPPQNLEAQEQAAGIFAHCSQWISHFSDKTKQLIPNRIPVACALCITANQ